MIELIAPKGRRVIVTADGTATFLYRQIVRVCHRRRIPFVALPHVETAIINRMVRLEAITRVKDGDPVVIAIYDLLIYSNKTQEEFFAKQYTFGPENQKLTLGSTRYCADWLQMLATLRPPALCLGTPD